MRLGEFEKVNSRDGIVDMDRGKIPTETCVKNKIYVREIPSKPYLIECGGVSGSRSAETD